jgi:hypothetical protein
MSGVFQNIDPHPLTARRVCVPPPAFGAGEVTIAGWKAGGGSIFWKTPDTALYSIYASTLWSQVLAIDFKKINTKWPPKANWKAFKIYNLNIHLVNR